MSEERMRELRRRWVLLYSALMFSIVAAAVFFLLAYAIDQDPSYSYAIMLLLLAGMYVGMNLARLARLRIPRYRTVKVVRCEKCGYTKVEAPRKGDYVFKEEEACPRCGGNMVIYRIYREKIG
ncbi:MAG: hypothetical protein DRJ56_00900 [Thermoprotei archaeon]|nr:MAG: hypothetical protein DRJ56_00900 [Thermoprotei archaeon]